MLLNLVYEIVAASFIMEKEICSFSCRLTSIATYMLHVSDNNKASQLVLILKHRTPGLHTLYVRTSEKWLNMVDLLFSKNFSPITSLITDERSKSILKPHLCVQFDKFTCTRIIQGLIHNPLK